MRRQFEPCLIECESVLILSLKNNFQNLTDGTLETSLFRMNFLNFVDHFSADASSLALNFSDSESIPSFQSKIY